jgi:hypothetical protein
MIEMRMTEHNSIDFGGVKRERVRIPGFVFLSPLDQSAIKQQLAATNFENVA